MDDVEKLEVLKLNLQRTGTKLDPLLRQMLAQAAKHLAQTGITIIPDDPGDDALQIDYAAYLYRRRADPEAQMPQFLRWDIHNRLLSQKGRVDG